MLHNFGLYKRPLLTVLAVLLTTAFTTASAAMIDLSQLTPNTTQPVALSTIQSSTSNEAPTLAPETNMEPVIKVAANTNILHRFLELRKKRQLILLVQVMMDT